MIVAIAGGRIEHPKMFRAGKQISSAFMIWVIYQNVEMRDKPRRFSEFTWFMFRLSSYLVITWVWWGYTEIQQGL